MAKTINEILSDYTAYKITLEEANEQLKEADSAVILEPGKNDLTEEDKHVTVVGWYPDQACGYGLLDTGTGTMEKVHVEKGVLPYPVNEVSADGSVNMPALFWICGKMYHVAGDKLVD